MDMLRKYLLSSVFSAPNDGRGAARPRVTEALTGDAGDDTNDPLVAADAEIDGEQDPPLDPDDADDEGGDSGDSGDGDDDADDGEGDGDEDEPPPPQRSRGRRDSRIAALSEQNRLLREQAEAAQRRLDAMEQAIQRPAKPPEDPRDREARLALMSPEERMQARMDEALHNNSQQTQAVLASLQDQSDRVAFEALLARKPQYAKFADKVHARAKEMRDKGTPLPREAVLIWLVGETAYKSTQEPRTRKQSEQRMRGQQTRPGSGRSDARGGDRRDSNSNSTAARERRLSNLQI